MDTSSLSPPLVQVTKEAPGTSAAAAGPHQQPAPPSVTSQQAEAVTIISSEPTELISGAPTPSTGQPSGEICLPVQGGRSLLSRALLASNDMSTNRSSPQLENLTALVTSRPSLQIDRTPGCGTGEGGRAAGRVSVELVGGRQQQYPRPPGFQVASPLGPRKAVNAGQGGDAKDDAVQMILAEARVMRGVSFLMKPLSDPVC